MTPDDVTRCNERSILSGREKVKGASVSGSWERREGEGIRESEQDEMR